MKNNIVTQLRSVNPIERFRDKQALSQKDFAATLGYGSATSYRHHSNTFSPDILRKIYEKYGLDLRDEVIRHLRSRMKSVKKAPVRGDSGPTGSDYDGSYADWVG